MSSARSLLVWVKAIFFIFAWLLLLAMRRLLDRDPVRYQTGLLFRKLGRRLTRSNPSWKLEISGAVIDDPRRPYVVVSNHQSMADIPLISNLPWEMKWMAKEELFRLPVLGWMMRLAGDICVDRKSARSGAQALIRAQRYLERKCSVMIFPEGTRTTDGRVRPFAEGAFHLAIRAGVPVLPLAVDGSRDCLPKHTWRFGKPSEIRLKILSPVETSSLTSRDVQVLRDTVRLAIVAQLAEWRSAPVESVDGCVAQ